MARHVTRDCLVCGTPFTQVAVPGTLRKMCSKACSLRRIRERKNRAYSARYASVRQAGGDRAFATWAMQGSLRTEAALEVLKESE